MLQRGLEVVLLGATGAVGGEILGVLEERHFPVTSLRAFASEDSEGLELEFLGEPIRVEALVPHALPDCDLILSAAPDVLEDLLPELRQAETCLVDVTGALELEPSIPLYLPGFQREGAELEGSRWLAIPRGVAAGLGLVLAPLAREAGLERVTALCLESTSGAGLGGAAELTDQTVHLLNAMTGDPGEPQIFPRAVAFDCLPVVGEVLEGEETSEERRLRHVLRRLLGLPTLPVESTRVRVPIFGGSLTCAHVELVHPLTPDRARALWEKQPYLELMGEGDLPTPRSSMGRDGVRVGRVRSEGEEGRRLAFVMTLDDLRYGSALAAVLAAETLFRLD